MIIAGLQDNGTNLYIGNKQWVRVGGADGMESLINYNDIVYSSSQNGGLYYSSEVGVNQRNMRGPYDPVRGAWTTPLQMMK